MITKGSRAMAKLDIYQFLCLSDNFGVLIHDNAAGVTASIDAPDAAAVRAALAKTGWKLTHILTTHPHADHVDGNLELKNETKCLIVGPKGEADKIPGIDIKVGGGDKYQLGSFEAKVLDTPGHTLGHISYWFPEAKVAFVGDTLFALGCGRILEGDPKMMWDSLQRLAALPPETAFYCGHEYTQANARFNLTIEPGNAALVARSKEIDALRSAGKPTLPSTIGAELATNVFLRAQSPEIQTRLAMLDEQEWKVFAEIRARKNRG